MVKKVKFSKGTYESFDRIEKDSNTVYFLTDTQEIYLGEVKYSTISEIGDLSELTTVDKDTLVDSINELSEKLPPVPSTNGTYYLSAVVTNGVPAFSWEDMPQAAGNNF